MLNCTNCGMEFIDDGKGYCSKCGHSMRNSLSTSSEMVGAADSLNKEQTASTHSTKKTDENQSIDYNRLVPPKVGLFAIVALGIIGLGGHFVGLKTIGSYSEVRSEIRGSEQLIKDRKAAISNLNQELSQITASKDAAQSELISLESQVAEAKRTKTLAYKSIKSAQEDLARDRQSRADAVSSRDSALAARDQANKTKTNLLKEIESLTTQKTSLAKSLQTLQVTRANLDDTLKSLAQESKTLSEIRRQLDESRIQLEEVERQRAIAEKKLAIDQTLQKTVDIKQGDIKALEAQKNHLNGIVSELNSRVNKADETLTSVTSLLSQKQTALANTVGQLESTLKDQDKIDKELSLKRAERDKLITQVDSLQTQANQFRGTVSELQDRVNKANETLTSVSSLLNQKQTALAIAGEKLESTLKDQSDLDKILSSKRAERDKLSPQIESAQTQINQFRGIISGLESHLTKLRAEEIDATSKVSEAALLSKSIDKQRKQQDKLQSEIDSFIARRTTMQKEVSTLDAEIAERQQSISTLNERLQRLREEESSKFLIFERVLRSLEAALNAGNAITPNDENSNSGENKEKGGN